MVSTAIRAHRRSWSLHVPQAFAGFARRIASPHRAALANLASIPLTVAGIGCVDAGVFVANTIAGLLVTGVSLILLEHAIADEP